MDIDLITLRHKSDDLIFGFKNLNLSLINSGSGKTHHPSQALLDAVTIYDHFKSFEGLKVSICGDINNSRVASSDIELFEKLGMRVYLSSIEKLEDKYSHLKHDSLDELIPESDVLIFLRVQKERHEHEMDTNHYNKKYGLNLNRIKKMKKNSIFMHPGPVNWGVELHSEIKNHSQSKIQDQIKFGLYTRIAIIDWLLKDNENVSRN